MKPKQIFLSSCCANFSKTEFIPVIWKGRHTCIQSYSYFLLYISHVKVIIDFPKQFRYLKTKTHKVLYKSQASFWKQETKSWITLFFFLTDKNNKGYDPAESVKFWNTLACHMSTNILLNLKTLEKIAPNTFSTWSCMY